MKKNVKRRGKKKRCAETTRDGGFTFAETLAVLAIMLILSAGVGVSATKYVQKARVLKAASQIEVFSLALQSYYLDCGTYPTQEQGLGALWEKPALYPVPRNWNGPYVDRKPGADPWGNSYVYSRGTGQKVPFVIVSLGADGLEGGEGQDADIVSFE